MKILVACDMEGISGVITWEHVSPGNPDYERFRRIMTAEVNAAIAGAFEGGATEVVVTDGHSFGTNLLLEELDPRARLNSGNASPFAMMQGIDTGVQGVLFIGYHARAGTPKAILDHTWSSRCLTNLWLNDEPVGEIGLNAALAGSFGVPVLMVSGDLAACAEAKELLGPLDTVMVKQSSGRMAADCLPPSVVHERIRLAARRAVENLDSASPHPFIVEAPVEVLVELPTSDMADRASLIPGAKRVDGRMVSLKCQTMPEAYKGMRALLLLARS